MKPVLFSIGSFSFSSFGFFAAVAFLIGTFLVWRQGRNERLSEEKILDSVFATTAYIFVGARIGHVLLHFNEFSPSLLRFFLIWKFPGLSLAGALLFGIIGVLISARRKKFNLWHIFDIYAHAGLLVVLFLGLGGLLDGAEVGRVTNLFWGVSFAGVTELRHPIGLYEALFAILAFGGFHALHKQFEKQRKPYGVSALLIFFSFNLFFFILGFFKENPAMLSGFDVNQIVFGCGVLVSIVLLYYRLGRRLQGDIASIVQRIRKRS